ncbi:hypothetical protein KJ819_02190 [Patescibacteria group bacterium]|nr:hypothetical protein [Patescibacteria group bacterium]MBU1500906.1 hypothetical protein [Patescibacteria group bacterium]MBU2080961.1 hypothetical protein [Patescibacteria group bacterium]MBU2124066.1 hypothetical protein [Patescibacteria group bacterium]MBU2194643.1 hypothetical protein [Patescibacteria group bacterium]
MSSGGGHGGGLPFLHIIDGWLGNAHQGGGFSMPGNALFIAGAAELIAFFLIAPQQTLVNFEFLLFLSPLWIPLLLGRFALIRFIQARRVEYIATQDTVLLELKLPRDTRKPPLAMETILANLHLASGEATWYKRYVLGRSRPWYSLELVSLGGKVHMYIWTRETFRRPIETFLYAQYPGIEVIEASDYSRLTDPTHAPYKMTAFEFLKTTIDAYPIKTYTDFGLDMVQKPEETVDPLAQLLETLGSLGPKEQAWVQLIVRASKAEKYEGRKNASGKNYDWKDEGKEEIERIRQELVIQNKYVDAMGNLQTTNGFPNPTEGQKDKIKAIERNIGKLAYDVGIRAIYLAPGDSYHKSMGSLMSNLFKPFTSEQYNGLKPGSRWSEHFNDYPWEDFGGHHLAHAMHTVLEFYRMRAFFHPPYTGKWNTMSIEELASLFHIPSSSVTTPSLPRIQSTSNAAPSNLPT